MLEVDKVIHHGGETGGVGHLRGRPCQVINLRAKKVTRMQTVRANRNTNTQKKKKKNQTLLACWTLMRDDVRVATACTGGIQLDQDAPQAPHLLSEL